MKQESKNISKIPFIGPIVIGGLVLIAAGSSVYNAIEANQNAAKIETLNNKLNVLSDNVTSLQSSLDEIKTNLKNGGGGDVKSAVQNALKSLEDDKLASQRVDLYKGLDSTSKNAEGRYVYGNPSARFTLVNYEDLECPFCKRFHETPKYLVDNAMNGAVNWEWRHYPMSFHEPLASKAAMVSECVAQQKGPKGFWAATNYWFTKTEGNGKGFPGMDEIPALFEVDKDKFDACMTDKNVIQNIKRDMLAGQKDNVNGTPTTLIVDNTTGKEVPIVGAQPFSKFVEVINEMVKGETSSETQKETAKPVTPEK